ncbi:UDP-N-acetylglucosamine 4,6-dehydratase (inverting) [Prochlorococcus sp. MIT 1307]|uniref:UDP-N-acetylglucosamine 4,6-dehydratase (inverting) n=1 Tax=Prochlorococcus sp. MIT 1307 TaxID=3096219 RepID=UPI002A74CCFD|nr:UDP-N-acetylglucosamine 4,6-dehydratase (inverting) [Prochlorococcus sp. MIT 1307]
MDIESILITGGTGSFGKAFIKRILTIYPKIKRVVVFSRDELKQWEMQNNFPENKFPQMRFFLGDVRDIDRLKCAFLDINVVVHAAALKQVPAAEYNPMEFIKTNIIGAENIIRAALETNVKRVVALSTDKAAAPSTLYGATKLCSDKLFVAANNIKGKQDIRFSVVRYGNVLGSRGSVIPHFLKQRHSGVLEITHKEMTRFNITLDDGVDLVLQGIKNNIGGEILIPKLSTYKITDVANAVGPNCLQKEIGIRPGEKINEEMITEADSYSCIDLGRNFCILPSGSKVINKYKENGIKFSNVPIGFSYNSGTNKDILSVEQIRQLIKQNLDPSFTPI